MGLFSSDRNKRERKIKEKLNFFLNEHDAKLVNFEYYYEIFGNIVIDIEFMSITHRFVTDRGEIYHNENLVCDNSYHVAGKSDTLEMLVKVIEEKLFLKIT